jgi:hypothetical protein
VLGIVYNVTPHAPMRKPRHPDTPTTRRFDGIGAEDAAGSVERGYRDDTDHRARLIRASARL